MCGATFLCLLALLPCMLAQTYRYENYDMPGMMIRLHERQKYLSQVNDEEPNPRTILEQIRTVPSRAQSVIDLFSSRPRVANVSGACMNSTLQLLDGLLAKQTWALQMIDATTKIPSGILEGKLRWMGSHAECVKVTATSNTNSTVSELFKGKYCQAIVGNISTMSVQAGIAGLGGGPQGGLTIGLCVPSTCSSEDTEGLVNAGLFFLPEDIQAGYTFCQEDIPLDGPAIGVICMLVVLGAFILAGTLYDILIHRQTIKKVMQSMDAVGPGTGMTNSDIRTRLRNDEYAPLLGDQNERHEARNNVAEAIHNDQTAKEGLVVQQEKPRSWQKLLVGVSIYSNGAKLLSTASSGQELRAIHGIRFLSMSWVILGHTIGFGMMIVSNLVDTQEFLQRWTFQAIINATVSVDTFFVLSGLLMTYLVLTEMKKKNGKLNWAMFYFHRFWRLTPPYMLILGVHTALFKYWGSGPNWQSGGIEPNCPKYWWTNLLYINNIVWSEQMCMGWSWYLSNDMQFFVISPLILIPLYRWPLIGYAIIGVLLLTCFTTTGVISSVNGYGTGFASFIGNNGQNMNELMAWFNDLYLPPWTRIGPYLIGMLVGYALYRTERKVRLHWAVVVIGWMVAAAVNLAVLYGLYDVASTGKVLSVGLAAFYNAVNRSAWAVGVGWVIFACVTGYGGWVNTLLSWPALIPLSRLTYMAYLVHPIIMYAYYLSRENLFFIDNFQIIYLFLGHLVFSYIVAFGTSLVFEGPMMGLEKVIFHKKKTPPSKHTEATDSSA